MAGKETPEKENLHFETTSIHAGLQRSENGIKDVPIYASTSFVFNDSAHGAAIFSMNDEAFCYSRIRNPTVDSFEKRMAALEGGAAALATATGEAALFVTITALAQRGDNIIVASPRSEVTSHQFRDRFPALGITARFVDNGDVSKVQASIDGNTKAVFLESMPIEASIVSDIESLSSLAHENGIPLIVDNTNGASGYFMRPIDHGADFIVASCTPWISISGDIQAGILIDSGKFPFSSPKSQPKFPQLFEPSPGFHGLKIWEKFGHLSLLVYARIAIMRDIGPCLNPFEASSLMGGVETLAIRMKEISTNALELAQYLQEFIGEINYQGLSPHLENSLNQKYLRRGSGGLFSFSSESKDFEMWASKLKIVSRGQSIGGSRTMMISKPLGPGPSHDERNATIRVVVSVGLENIEDLKADFARAFYK